MSNTMKTLNHHKGFTLLEVMIALVIFSVGLLGLAGMQMGGMQNNHSALLRTIATQHTYDIAERIRSSRGSFIVDDGAGNTSCSGASCTTVISDDYDAWIATIGQTLPSGKGTVTNIAGGAVLVTVRWDEDRNGATGTNCPPQGPVDLQCIQLTIVP